MSTRFVTKEAAARPSRVELRERWRRMVRDPLLAAVPGKLELNEKGSIELSPPSNRHALLQAFVAGELMRLMPDGTTFTECSVETEIGVRVPDVAWASAEFMRRHGTTTPFPSAPELCIEVLSPSNTRVEIHDKVDAYLAAGAREVWVVAEDGNVDILDEDGARLASVFGIAITPPKP